MQTRWLLIALPLAVVLTGCGKGPFPVQGVVTLDGAPIAGATVLFMPEEQDKGRPASGFTQADGTFQLMTQRSNDGALPGKYRVVVQKTDAPKDRDAAEKSAQERAKGKLEDQSAQKNKKPILPPVYAKFDTTPLRCTVPTTGVVALDLHKDGKP